MDDQRRKTFGFLTYLTLAIGAIVLSIEVGQWVSEWRNREEEVVVAKIDPVEQAEARLNALMNLYNESQLNAIKTIDSVGESLALPNTSPRAAMVRKKFSKTLRNLLKSENPNFRYHAAELIGQFGRGYEEMAGALTPLLHDNELSVRISAASALLGFRTTREASLHILAEMAADPLTLDRSVVIKALLAGRGPGHDAVLKALTQLLKNPDPNIRANAVRSTLDFTKRLDRQRLLSAFEPLLKSDDLQVRVSAAIIMEHGSPVMSFSNPVPYDPRVITILEGAVVDPTLPLELRTQSLTSLPETRLLYGSGVTRPDKIPTAFGIPGSISDCAPIFYRCGQALVRQLSDGDVETRYSAATLLRLINPGVVAGKFPGAPVASTEVAPKP